MESRVRTSSGKWLGLLAVAGLCALCMSSARATRPLYIPCGERHPTFATASLDTLMGKLRTATSADWESECLVRQLPRFGASAVPPLVTLLRSGPEQGRVNAVYGLRTLGEQERAVLPDLEVALDDPSANVRWLASSDLAALRPRSPALTLQVLRRLDAQEERGLVYLLPNLGSLPPEALPVLSRVLDRLGPYDRLEADMVISAMGHVASVQRVVVLARLVGSKDTERAWAATLAVGRSGLVAMPALLYFLGDADAQQRQAYVRALDWAWLVATTPSLMAYFQADTTTLMRQLRAPLASVRADALRQLTSLAPAMLATIPSPWDQGVERLAVDRCDALDVLDDGVKTAADETERQSMMALAASMRRDGPLRPCHVPIY